MQKNPEIFKKCNFLGQTLNFLPPRKPGIYTSHAYFFFFEYHELQANSKHCQKSQMEVLSNIAKS